MRLSFLHIFVWRLVEHPSCPGYPILVPSICARLLELVLRVDYDYDEKHGGINAMQLTGRRPASSSFCIAAYLEAQLER
jgi:hypothetical protein